MKLSSSQRRRLVQGNYTPLIFDEEPMAGPCCVVLTWSRQERAHDGDGGRYTILRRPLRWIEVTSVKRHRKGGWQVRFDVTDLRETHRYLRSTPPFWDPQKGSTAEATVEADRSSYTSSRFASIDELEVVPAKFQSAVSKKAYDRDRTMRLERVAAERTARNRFRKTRLSAVEGFRTAA